MHKETAKASPRRRRSRKNKNAQAADRWRYQSRCAAAHLAAFMIRKAGYSPQQDAHIIPIGAGPTWLAALENRKVDVALTVPRVPETAFHHMVWHRPISEVILVVSVVFFLTFFNTYAGVKGVKSELKNIMRIMGATERQILMKVTLPAIVPWITTGLKISLPYAIAAAVVGEFIAASKGLGYLINHNTSLFSTTGALSDILILALVVVVRNEAINRAESYLLRWRPREEKKSDGEL
jgi:ABC-type nitrate/sulfonate/bicarbonate transport system permease component